MTDLTEHTLTAVETLLPGYRVDLEADPYADPDRVNPDLGEEYAEVESVEVPAGQRVVVVHFLNTGSVGFPVGHKVPVCAEDVQAGALVDDAVKGYVEAAVWTAQGSDGEEVGSDVEVTIPADVIAKVREDVIDFIMNNADDCLAYVRERSYDPSDGTVASHLGHDLLLTRNGHGAGFWDRGLGDLGDRLTAAAKVYGEQSSVVGANGDLDLF